jgi:hypothetical protein
MLIVGLTNTKRRKAFEGRHVCRFRSRTLQRKQSCAAHRNKFGYQVLKIFHSVPHSLAEKLSIENVAFFAMHIAGLPPSEPQYRRHQRRSEQHPMGSPAKRATLQNPKHWTCNPLMYRMRAGKITELYAAGGWNEQNIQYEGKPIFIRSS